MNFDVIGWIVLIVYFLGKKWWHNFQVDNYPLSKIDHQKFMGDVGRCSPHQLEKNMISGKYDKR